MTDTFSLTDTSGDDDISIQGTLDADQVTLSSQLSGATGTGEMSIEDATIAATQGITTTIGNIDIDNSTVNATSGQWSATVLRSIDLDANALFNAAGVDINATLGDSFLNFAGVLNSSEDATFSMGHRFIMVPFSEVNVTGDLSVSVDEILSQADASGADVLLEGDIATSGNLILTTGSQNDVIQVYESFGNIVGDYQVHGGSGVDTLLYRYGQAIVFGVEDATAIGKPDLSDDADDAEEADSTQTNLVAIINNVLATALEQQLSTVDANFEANFQASEAKAYSFDQVIAALTNDVEPTTAEPDAPVIETTDSITGEMEALLSESVDLPEVEAQSIADPEAVQELIDEASETLPGLENLLGDASPEQVEALIEQLNSLSAQLEDADLDPEQALEVNQLFELLSQEVDGEAPAPEDIELLQQLLQDVEPEVPESDEADQQAEPETDSESNFDLETLAAQAGWGVIAAKARKKK